MTLTVEPRPLTAAVTVDLYRDIHKGIRSELFSTVSQAGSIDPADRNARLHVAHRVAGLVAVLDSHARHEDDAVQPALEAHQPRLAELIATDHQRLDARVRDLEEMALAVGAAGRAEARLASHQLYLELSSFTGAYLVHQDVEERVVMPALEAAVGVDAVVDIHTAIVSSIPPQETAQSLAMMLPAMNVDDRAELLGGMRASAPAEVFTGVWGLVGSVLSAPDVAALAARLDLPS